MPRRKAVETLTDKKRKMMVEDILTRGLEQGKGLAECWCCIPRRFADGFPDYF